MHLGRRYKLTEYLVWMRRETAGLFLWSVAVTAMLNVTGWSFLSIPAPLLAVVGTAVAIVLAFKNQQCHARLQEALGLWGQLSSASMILANNLATTIGRPGPDPAAPQLREMYYRHFAWLTALRFFLREPKTWENTHEAGNRKFLELLPTPESRSSLRAELLAYVPEAEADGIVAHKGDKEGLLLRGQYAALADLRDRNLIDTQVFVNLSRTLDELFRLQGAVKRIKSYPYPRNYYSIAVILVIAFVAIVPFGLFPYVRDLGKPAGTESYVAWLNVPFSVFVGWIFVTLEKVGENSSNPFEGGPNDVPISFLCRRIEIEMRGMLGEATSLKAIEPKFNILF